MTTPSEPAAVEREEQLAVLRKRMAKAMRRGEAGRYGELRAEHDRLKQAHMDASLEEHKAVVRARRAAERAQVAQEASRGWRLPRGFGVSPLAAQRAREGRPVEAAQVPAGGHLSPWRRSGGPMTERIWWP